MDRLKSIYIGFRAVALASAATLFVPALGGHGARAAVGDNDDRAWREAVSIDTAQAYQAYLDRFPTGRNANLAFRAIIERSVARSSPVGVDEAREDDEAVIAFGVVSDIY